LARTPRPELKSASAAKVGLMFIGLFGLLFFRWVMGQRGAGRDPLTELLAEEAAPAGDTGGGEPYRGVASLDTPRVIAPERTARPSGCADFHGHWQNTVPGRVEGERWLTIRQTGCESLSLNYYDEGGARVFRIGETTSYELKGWLMNRTFNWLDDKAVLYESFTNANQRSGMKCYGHSRYRRVEPAEAVERPATLTARDIPLTGSKQSAKTADGEYVLSGGVGEPTIEISGHVHCSAAGGDSDKDTVNLLRPRYVPVTDPAAK